MVRLVILLTICLSLSACGTARTSVENLSEEMIHARTIRIMPGEHTVYVPTRTHSQFAEDLAEELYEKIEFGYGDGVTVRYRFTGFDEGSRVSRFMFGGIGNAGESSIIISSDFIDQNGQILATIRTEGRIDSGFMGGGMSSALERAAEDIADYARANFYSRY